MSVEEEAIASQHAAAVGRGVCDSVLRRTLYEAAQRLHRYFVLREFGLRECRRGHGGNARYQVDDRLSSKHLHSPYPYRPSVAIGHAARHSQVLESRDFAAKFRV